MMAVNCSWCRCGLASAEELRTLVGQARALHGGGFCVGGAQNETRWRDDTACWLTAPSTAVTLPALSHAISLLGCLAHELNVRGCLADEPEAGAPKLGLLRVPEGAMFAAYQGMGAAYRPHRDNARRDGGALAEQRGCAADRRGSVDEAAASAAGEGVVSSVGESRPPLSPTPPSQWLNDRSVTLIIYLNDPQEWGDGDDAVGGELRLHPTARQCDDDALFGSGWQGGRDGGGVAGPVVDVLPHAGRVVLFRSELLHEVLSTHDGRLRLALSMWCVRLPL